MRKFCLTLFSFLLLCFSSYSQEPILKITRNYFRSDPFNKDFSSFLSHLLNDPALTNKIIEKRTDSTLFYLQGTYTAHNPFFFKPKRVQVVLTELEVNLDSLIRDTIYNYQLFAYDSDTKEGVEEVKKEFDKIFRRYKGSFRSNQYTENPAGNQSNGATYNFFDPLHAVAPFALSWFGPNENKEMCLVLTIRMDTYNNRAILPVPFYTPQ
jgi:hypothetical protein